MSTNKISTKTLTDAIAKRLGISQVAAEKFVSEFQSIAETAVLNDKLLKIGGLGTFKLVWNEARKSVNVQTGEPIEIAGHYKLNFIPEVELKNKVNYNTAATLDTTQNATTVVNAPLQKLGEQAEELKDILESINGEPTLTEEVTVDDTPDFAQSDLSTTEIPIEEPVKESEPIESKEEVVKLEDLVQQTTADEYRHNDDYKCPRGNKKCCSVIWIIVAVVLLCGIAVACYFWREPICKSCQTISNTVVSWFACDKEQSIAIPADTVSVAESQIDTIVPVASTIFDAPRNYTDFIATETVGKGSRLTWIAYKYYGNKIFWVYLYEANRQVVSGPNQVRAGAKIRIPKLPDELIDVNNPACIEYANKLHEQYLKQ